MVWTENYRIFHFLSNAVTSPVTGPTLSANDALALLVSSNLFMEAVKVAKVFKLDCRPIVEGKQDIDKNKGFT